MMYYLSLNTKGPGVTFCFSTLLSAHFVLYFKDQNKEDWTTNVAIDFAVTVWHFMSQGIHIRQTSTPALATAPWTDQWTAPLAVFIPSFTQTWALSLCFCYHSWHVVNLFSRTAFSALRLNSARQWWIWLGIWRDPWKPLVIIRRLKNVLFDEWPLTVSAVLDLLVSYNR